LIQTARGKMMMTTMPPPGVAFSSKVAMDFLSFKFLIYVGVLRLS